MVSLSGLSVKVSAQTADFRAGMSRAKETAQDVSLALSRLAFSGERAESSLDEVGNSAARATGGMVAFGAGTEGAGFSVRGFSASILLSLVPALVTLSATLVPIVAALGGFVAIAGAIAGIGLVGTLGAIAQFGDQLKVVFNRITSVLQEEFAPAIDLAAEVLFILLDEFLQIIPELVPAQDVVQELAGNFAQLGKEFINLLPALVDLATTLAMEFLPPFVTFVQEVLPDVPGFIRALVDSFRRILPMFHEAGRILRRLGPPLLEFGFTALNVVAPVLAMLTTEFIDVLQVINSFDQGIQETIASLALVAPILTGLVSLLGGPVTLGIAAFASAWATNFGGIRDTTNNAFGDIEDTVTNGLSNIRDALGPFEKEIKLAFKAMETAVGIAFDAVLGLINFLADAFLTSITVILQALAGNWGKAFTTMSDFAKRTLNNLLSFANKWGSQFINNIVAGIGKAFNQLPRTTQTIIASVLGTSAGTLRGFATLAQQQGTTQNVQGQQAERSRLQQQGIQITVEGDTGVIKNVSAEVVEERARRAARLENRGSGF